MTRKVNEAERQEALNYLKELNLLTPGTTVYCILRHVSRSGMQRIIDLKVINCDDPEYPTRSIGYLAARALGLRFDRDRQGVVVGGCGMDMGFHLVYSLGRVLFPEGFAVEGRGRNGDTSGWDNDGGYALKHVWA